MNRANTLPEEAVQRRPDLRRVFDALKWITWTGAPWRALPHDFPPGPIVYQQAMRWLAAGVFEAMVHDLRVLLRDFAGRKKRPTAAILDSRTLQSTPESGHRTGYNGAKRKRGSKLHLAVDTLGHLLAAQVTPADQPDRDQVERLAAAVQAATGESVEIAYVDQAYPGETPAKEAAAHGIRLVVVKHPEAKRGLCYCRGAGWSSDLSPGPPASAASPGTINACPPSWPASISSPSPVSW
jgi:transposase